MAAIHDLTDHERERVFLALCVNEARKIRLDAFESRVSPDTLFRRRIDGPIMNPQTEGYGHERH